MMFADGWFNTNETTADNQQADTTRAVLTVLICITDETIDTFVLALPRTLKLIDTLAKWLGKHA